MVIEPFRLPHPAGNGSTDFPGYDIPDRSVCVITGPNGAGKTTLLKFLNQNQHLLHDGETVSAALLDAEFSPPPTARPNKRSVTENCAETFTTVSMWLRSTCLHYVSERKT